jgi:hypothetical protein
MQLTILGKRWLLSFTQLPKGKDGDCDSPDTPRKEIRIHHKLKGRARLEAIVHEMLHAADWTKDEEWIHYTAADIARELTKLGYTHGSEEA